MTMKVTDNHTVGCPSDSWAFCIWFLAVKTWLSISFLSFHGFYRSHSWYADINVRIYFYLSVIFSNTWREWKALLQPTCSHPYQVG